MKRLRLPVTAFLLLSLLISVFAGCAPKIGESVTDPPAATAESVSLLTGENEPVPAEYTPDFVSVRDVTSDFTVIVNAPADYTAERVLSGVTLKNLTNPALTDPDETDLLEPDRLTAEGENGTFMVSCKDGFKEGEVYQIVLTDASLTYAGEDDAIRFFNLTTAEKRRRTFVLPLRSAFCRRRRWREKTGRTPCAWTVFSGMIHSPAPLPHPAAKAVLPMKRTPTASATSLPYTKAKSRTRETLPTQTTRWRTCASPR